MAGSRETGRRGAKGERQSGPSAPTQGPQSATPRGHSNAGVNDLSRISGIGPHLASKLRDCGIATIEDLANATEEDMAEIEQDLDFKGRIARDDWIRQARELLDTQWNGAKERRRRKSHDGKSREEEERNTDEGAAREEQRQERWLTTAPIEFRPEYRAPLPRRTTHAVDRAFKAQLARMTLSITPAGLAAAMFDWMAHLAISPGKQLEILEHAGVRYGKFLLWLMQTARDPSPDPCLKPLPNDDRFDDPRWQQWPFNVSHQSFLLVQEFWQDALSDVEGFSAQKQNALSFVARQILDHASPSNFVATNPEVLHETLENGGMNLVRGAQNAIEDWERFVSGRLPVGAEDFVIGKDLAATEGKVVFRNHLIELIQYAPKTDEVYPEPILITPAWIMKYYILDLSPHNSLVRFLVEQGFTVFMISWRNPTAEDRDLGMNDYIRMGFFDALKAVNAIVPRQKVHAIGYCLGGTLLTMAAAAMALDRDDRLKTITLFDAQTDFTEAGEIMLFVSESQVSYLESLMWDQGYLDSHQMAGAFQMLRSNDLVWSRYINEYLLGRRQKMIDLIAWNADATRMPYKMHSEYLRKLFLQNQLARGRFVVGEDPVSISDIRQPVFCVSATEDHVAPWHSVYKLHLLADTDITFVLANRGHNGGIVSEPGHKGRKYQIRTTPEGSGYVPHEDWREETPEVEGSWWHALVDWLQERSSKPAKPPGMGAPNSGYRPLLDAPGTYIHRR
jgi:polyhydroxyalkanoate synthase